MFVYANFQLFAKVLNKAKLEGIGRMKEILEEFEIKMLKNKKKSIRKRS